MRNVRNREEVRLYDGLRHFLRIVRVQDDKDLIEDLKVISGVIHSFISCPSHSSHTCVRVLSGSNALFPIYLAITVFSCCEPDLVHLGPQRVGQERQKQGCPSRRYGHGSQFPSDSRE